MNAFSRSWYITKLSFRVIGKDKEMLLFPLLGGIFSILFLLAMVFPTIIFSFTQGDALQIFDYVIMFLTYLGLAFIATFFNTCVVYTTKKRFEGGDATFKESLRFGISRIHLIFAWSLVSAIVGVLLRVLENIASRMGGAGKIIFSILISLLGAAWSIITIFVVPAMVYKEVTPFAAIKESINTLKKTWGESLIRYYGLGLVQMLFIVLGVLVGIGLTIGLAITGIVGIIAGILITVIYIIAVVLIFNVANQVFNTALYYYATTGKVPQGFDDTVKHAFQKQ
ncbi:MAG: DUF6159 family protein [Candidatus Woesearchaeota archaeon]